MNKVFSENMAEIDLFPNTVACYDMKDWLEIISGICMCENDKIFLMF